MGFNAISLCTRSRQIAKSPVEEHTGPRVQSSSSQNPHSLEPYLNTILGCIRGGPKTDEQCGPAIPPEGKDSGKEGNKWSPGYGSNWASVGDTRLG